MFGEQSRHDGVAASDPCQRLLPANDVDITEGRRLLRKNLLKSQTSLASWATSSCFAGGSLFLLLLFMLGRIGASSVAAIDIRDSLFVTSNVINEAIDLRRALISATTTEVKNWRSRLAVQKLCGRQFFPTGRIVGGERASFGQWPWLISLRQLNKEGILEHKCGAALINQNWAITAAHCIEDVPPEDLLLRLGEYDLSSENEPYGYVERRAQVVASHPGFDPESYEHDLALIRFDTPVAFQPHILPICLPEVEAEDFLGRTGYAAGWGKLFTDGPLPSILQQAALPVVENSKCEAMYNVAGFDEHIPNMFLCAGLRSGRRDSCTGDSGGPFVIQQPDSRWMLAGVNSWGIGCGEPNRPGVYTRVSEFRHWIDKITGF